MKWKRPQDTVENLISKRESLQQLIVRLEERANELDQAQDEVIYLKDLKRRETEFQNRLDTYDEELRSYVTVVAKRLVLPLLKERTVKLRTQVNKAERTTTQVTSAKAQHELIANLLSEVNCICGRELDGEARQFLEKRSKELADLVANSQRVQERTGSYNANLTELKDLENRINQIEGLADPETIQKALLTKYHLQVQLEEVTQDIAARESKHKGDQNADVAQVFTTLGEKKQELKELDNQIRQAEDEVKLAEATLTQCQKALNEALRNIDDKKGVVDTLQLTLAAQAVAKEMIEQMLHLRRESIEQQMTNVFRMVTNKKNEYDRIELAADFAPCIVTHSSQMMRSADLSAGEKEILAFSFIAGLNQSTETNAPLIMDTPFGHLDVQHRNGLLDALPKLPCQVILLATDRDLPQEELPNLSYCLGGRFDIMRDPIEEKSYIKAYR